MVDLPLTLLCKLVSCASAKKFDKLPGIFGELKNQQVDSIRVYESLLQLYLFNGFPCSIESLKLFKEHFPDFQPSNQQYNVNLFEKRGSINCKQVYVSNFDKLQQNIVNLSPDLAEWMIIEGYGKVMGRPGLSMQERELLNVAMLCTNFAEHQLFSHIKGSLNTGSDYETIREVIESTQEFNSPENIQRAKELLVSIANPRSS
jgi:alkylhydroperoxidase/carboxymuconolactone decarboxylase family protein YurZ